MIVLAIRFELSVVISIKESSLVLKLRHNRPLSRTRDNLQRVIKGQRFGNYFSSYTLIVDRQLIDPDQHVPQLKS